MVALLRLFLVTVLTRLIPPPTGSESQRHIFVCIHSARKFGRYGAPKGTWKGNILKVWNSAPTYEKRGKRNEIFFCKAFSPISTKRDWNRERKEKKKTDKEKHLKGWHFILMGQTDRQTRQSISSFSRSCSPGWISKQTHPLVFPRSIWPVEVFANFHWCFFENLKEGCFQHMVPSSPSMPFTEVRLSCTMNSPT